MEMLKVLILEDDENDLDLIKRELTAALEYQFQFHWVITRSDFVKALYDFHPDLVLSDYNLPQFNGLEALTYSIEADVSTPFIIVTGTLLEEAAADSIKAGAWDYVVKERLHRLPGAVENALKRRTETLKARKAAMELKLIREKSGLQVKLLYDAIDHAPSSVVITDQEGTILYVNPKFEEVTGYRCEEAVGQNPRILKSGIHERQFYQELWNTIKNGSTWKGELINKKKSGELYWEEVSISPISDEEGRIQHYVAIKHDISERKRSEQELIKAKEQAEESDRLKSAFLATMSHELRTPLNAVVGFSELINKDMAQSEVLELAKKIHQSGKHLLSIIESMFEISMLEARVIKPTVDEFPILDFFSSLKEYLRKELAKLQKSDILIVFSPPENGAGLLLRSDRGKLHLLMSNLLNNAARFTDRGVIEFGCSIKESAVTFFVKDTGIGIPRDQTEVIFERFRQVDNSLTRLYGGIGLGLTICHEIAELLGGDIWLESEPGKGSTFYFRLLGVCVNRDRTNGEPPILTSSTTLVGKTILIVEDELDNYLLLEIILGKEKATVLSAHNGEEAIQLCATRPDIDLVLMDIRMPGLSGDQALKRVKELRQGLPVIAQTAYATQAEINKFKKEGFDGFVTKPINKTRLLQVIRENLQ